MTGEQALRDLVGNLVEMAESNSNYDQQQAFFYAASMAKEKLKRITEESEKTVVAQAIEIGGGRA